jgi:hypothetical protein
MPGLIHRRHTVGPKSERRRPSPARQASPSNHDFVGAVRWMAPAGDRARGLLDHLRPSALFRRRDPDGRIVAPRDPATSKRNIQYVSFRGTKREAQVKLGELVAAVGHGSYIEPSKVTSTS